MVGDASTISSHLFLKGLCEYFNAQERMKSARDFTELSNTIRSELNEPIYAEKDEEMMKRIKNAQQKLEKKKKEEEEKKNKNKNNSSFTFEDNSAEKLFTERIDKWLQIEHENQPLFFEKEVSSLGRKIIHQIAEKKGLLYFYLFIFIYFFYIIFYLYFFYFYFYFIFLFYFIFYLFLFIFLGLIHISHGENKDRIIIIFRDESSHQNFLSQQNEKINKKSEIIEKIEKIDNERISVSSTNQNQQISSENNSKEIISNDSSSGSSSSSMSENSETSKKKKKKKKKKNNSNNPPSPNKNNNQPKDPKKTVSKETDFDTLVQSFNK